MVSSEPTTLMEMELQSRWSGDSVRLLSKEELEANKQDQDDELSALHAIYGSDFCLTESQFPAFKISVNVEIDSDFVIKAILPDIEDATSDSSAAHSFSIRHLSLLFHGMLPPDYPSHSAPLFQLEASWLSDRDLARLCIQLDSVWHDLLGGQGQVAIYAYVDWLGSEALEFLGFKQTLVLGPKYGTQACNSGVDWRARSSSVSFEKDVVSLLSLNEKKENEEFECSLHLCQVCFDEKTGSDFVRLSCRHSFCQLCLKTFCEGHVAEGSVGSIICPDSSCRAAIGPSYLKSLLSAESFSRWELLTLQRTLDSMSDLSYCPRCGTPTLEESSSDNLAQCPACFFAFCTLCRASWHAGQECMDSETKLKILQARSTGRKEEEEKIRKLIDETMNLQYLKTETKTCPSCKMSIVKTEGCNKMTCSNCQKYFCYKCGQGIPDYTHFSSGACNLFDEYIPPPPVFFPARDNFHEAQYAQAAILAFPRRRRRCPLCAQESAKVGNNNHIMCWNCQNHFCGLCFKAVKSSAEHFGPRKCRQHTYDDG